MEQIRIALVEDDERDREQLEVCLMRYQAEEKISMNIECFSDGEVFLKSKQRFDLIFMDIEMPCRNGIEIMKEYRRRGTKEVLVLVTNMVQYAIYGYSVHAIDYIVKPVLYEQLVLKMPFFLSMVIRKKKTITVKTKQGMSNSNIRDIRYIEIYGHNIIIHKNNENLKCYGTLKEFEEQLKNCGFARCSQSCLVNLAYVDGIRQDMILISSEQLPLSRRERKQFMESLTRFDGGYGE